MVHHARTGRAIVLGVAAALVSAAVLAVVPAVRAADPGGPPVRVMTRNLYLGADLSPAIEASTPAEALAAGASIFSVVRRTNFPERAAALAREIAGAAPDLLGLQEVAAWYSGPAGDAAPATDVEYDFLTTLLAELAAAGAPYDVVRVQDEADIEAPAGAPYFRDFRLVQRDAVLVRSGLGGEVRLRDVRSGHFATRLVVPTAAAGVHAVERGWISVDVAVDGLAFRFVSTHLEAFHPAIRLGQALELVAPTGPIGSAPGAVVLVGDLNSGPELPDHTQRLAFHALFAAGMGDTWRSLHPTHPGYTNGFGELLDEPLETALDQRIDHVMTRGGVGVQDARILGTDPANRTASGLWPSDHAGVAVTLLPGPA